MNELRREKLKRLIMKLPLGSQLLQLRRKIVNKLHVKKFYRQRSTDHLSVFQRYSQVPIEQVTAFEIGSGLTLAAPIGLSLLGFKKIITVDIRRAVPEYVQSTYKFYRKHAAEFGMKNLPQIKEKITAKNLDNFLLRNFNIDYRAPYDAAHTDLPDNSVDYVFANVVFEHIRAELFPGILKEMFRILAEGGVLYTYIDYKDHLADYKPGTTIYNYLQYTTEEWAHLVNYFPLHQNRLRTPDYLKMFSAAGFEIVELKKKEVTDADRAAFATVKVVDEFKNKYTDEELMEKETKFVLRKPLRN